MNKFRLAINLLALAIFMFAFAAVAQAQATRTWVSGVGDDANPCSRTAPCKTFAGAISKTAKDGEIDALDPAGFGALTITKSITVDGSMTGVAGVLNSLVNGVIINITDPADVRKSATLRGISYQGAGNGTRAIDILAASKVFVENCYIQNNSGDGITDTRSGGFLEVTNTSVINNAGNGINISPSGTTQINVHISNCRLQGNGARGLAVGNSGLASNVKVTMFETTISQNATGGVFAQTAGGSSTVAVDHSVVSNTNIGFIANTANAIIRVSNSTCMDNGGGLATTAGGGQVSSYGNNQTGGLAFPSTGTGQT